MPSFRGTDALRLLKNEGLDVPFIFVSGTIEEETAVQAMKAGAHDYLMKGNVRRLVPAVGVN
jgi:FixJ family two-component response regulator